MSHNIYNYNEKIGTVDSYNGPLKRLGKYKLVTSLILTANIIASILTGCSSSQQEKDQEIIDNQYTEYQSEIDDRIYEIVFDDCIITVNEEFLNKNGYIPTDSISARHEFIVNTMDEIGPYQFDETFYSICINYRKLYVEYLSSQYRDSYYMEKYIEEKQQFIIDMINKQFKIKYIIKAVPESEYVKDDIKYDDIRNIDCYIVKEGDTLSGIIDSYTVTKDEYARALQYAIDNNVFQSNDIYEAPDLLVVGERLNLGYVPVNKLSDLGLALDDGVAPKIRFIKKYYQKIDILAGDYESLALRDSVYTRTKECLEKYDKGVYVDTVLNGELTPLIKDYELLTGVRYIAPIIPEQGDAKKLSKGI